MTHDLNEISAKVTKVILSCKHAGQLSIAEMYIDQVMTYIDRMKLLNKRQAEIYYANLRGRLKMKVAMMNLNC